MKVPDAPADVPLPTRPENPRRRSVAAVIVVNRLEAGNNQHSNITRRLSPTCRGWGRGGGGGHAGTMQQVHSSGFFLGGQEPTRPSQGPPLATGRCRNSSMEKVWRPVRRNREPRFALHPLHPLHSLHPSTPQGRSSAARV